MTTQSEQISRHDDEVGVDDRGEVVGSSNARWVLVVSGDTVGIVVIVMFFAAI